MGKADLLCLRVPLKHGKIIDITETVSVLLNQVKLLSQLRTDLPRVIGGPLLLIRHKEYRIPGGKIGQFSKLSLLFFRYKLVNGAFVA